MTRYLEGQTIPYETRFEDALGAGEITATGVISLRRTDDDKYFDGVSAWQVAFVEYAGVKVGDANSPGFWRFPFDSSLGNDVDNYVAEMRDSSGNSVNQIELQFDQVGGYLDILDDKLDTMTVTLNKVVGLSHENFVLDPTDFDTTDPKEMIKGKVRIYDSKANADIDNGVTGLVAKYNIDAPRTLGVLDKFTMTLEP